VRTALLSHGGIGPPSDAHSVPALVNLTSELSRSLDLTVFVASYPGQKREDFRCGDALVHPLPATADSSYPRLFASFLRSFSSEHRSASFDLVQGLWAYPSGLAAVLLARRFGFPSVISVLGGEAASVPSISYGLLRHPFLKRIVLWTVRNATAVVASTRYQLGLLRSAGIRRNDIRIIPSGMPRSWLSTGTKRAPAPPYRIIHVANLTEVKDQQTLLKTFQILRCQVKAELRIIGPDYLGGRLQQMVADLRIPDVSFIGRVPHDRLRDHYRWADLMLHTSLYEGQGMVIAEAAASGVVVCGTDVGLLSDLGPDCGRASQPGDATGIAAAALYLLKNEPEFARLRANARRWAGEHTIEWTASEYRRLYEDLVKKGVT